MHLEGIKLGHRAMFKCPTGYLLQGNENATCLASGNWSTPVPTCIPIQCPPLFLDDPHISLVELNTSAWGRAVFRCSWGYRLSGPPSIECETSGRWSGAIPRCRGKYDAHIFHSVFTFIHAPHSCSHPMYAANRSAQWSHRRPFGPLEFGATQVLGGGPSHI